MLSSDTHDQGNSPRLNGVGRDDAVPLMRVGRLDTLRRVRAEAGRLYREARRREGRQPDALTAQRLANVLGAVAKSIEAQELAERLEVLEAKLAEKDSNNLGRRGVV